MRFAAIITALAVLSSSSVVARPYAYDPEVVLFKRTLVKDCHDELAKFHTQKADAHHEQSLIRSGLSVSTAGRNDPALRSHHEEKADFHLHEEAKHRDKAAEHDQLAQQQPN